MARVTSSLGAHVDEVAHNIGEPADEQGGPGCFAEGFVVNIIQGIKQKMGLDLGFEEVELGDALLFEHLFGLSFDAEIVDGESGRAKLITGRQRLDAAV